MSVKREDLETELLNIIASSNDDSVKVQAIGLLAKLAGFVGPERRDSGLKRSVRICLDKSKAEEKVHDGLSIQPPVQGKP